jgi:hypothetical protein
MIAAKHSLPTKLAGPFIRNRGAKAGSSRTFRDLAQFVRV